MKGTERALRRAFLRKYGTDCMVIDTTSAFTGESKVYVTNGGVVEFDTPMTKPKEFYNSDEEKYLDEMVGEYYNYLVLGDRVDVHNSDANDFANMISDLISARTPEEFDTIVATSGAFGTIPAVVAYVEHRKARLA